MQEMAGAWFHAHEGPQPFRIFRDDAGGDVPVGHQPVVAIKISHHLFEQVSALAEAR